MGYGCTWVADRPSVIATVAAGYADGLPRTPVGQGACFGMATRPARWSGRVSMDLITVDITHLPEVPKSLDILGPHQAVDALADVAGTIGYELLTALGAPLHPPLSGTPGMIERVLAALGRPVLQALAAVGRVALFAGAILGHILRPPFYLREFGHALLQIGWYSLPVVGLTAIFTGGALALQIYAGGARFNAESVVPSDRRHRHGARTWAGPGRADGRRARGLAPSPPRSAR